MASPPGKKDSAKDKQKRPEDKAQEAAESDPQEADSELFKGSDKTDPALETTRKAGQGSS